MIHSIQESLIFLEHNKRDHTVAGGYLTKENKIGKGSHREQHLWLKMNSPAGSNQLVSFYPLLHLKKKMQKN